MTSFAPAPRDPLPASDAAHSAALKLTMRRWRRLSLALSAIIGEHGFASLYARCLHQTASAFPWITQSSPQPAESAFVRLAADLHARTDSEAAAACDALLTIFIDTLIVLLGELLTNRILRAAWDDDVADAAGPEQQA